MMCLGRRRRIEYNRSRIGSFLMFHNGDTRAFCPDSKLFCRGCPESISSGQHDRFSLLRIILGQLADSRRLAYAIDTDNENHIGRTGAIRDRFVIFFQQGYDTFFQIRNDIIAILDFPALDAGTDLVEKIFRRFHADITGEHDRFQIIVHILVDFRIAADDGLNIFNQRAFRFFQTFA